MSSRAIPLVDLSKYTQGTEEEKEQFVKHWEMLSQCWLCWGINHNPQTIGR